jgi:hypothetical protein
MRCGFTIGNMLLYGELTFLLGDEPALKECALAKHVGCGSSRMIC